MTVVEPAYKAISRRKLAEVESKIPQEWRLPAIPDGLLSPEESITNTAAYEAVNVMDIPRRCGLLNPKQLDITEKFDVKGLLNEIASGRLSSKEVCEAFCKRAAISHQLTRCLTEPLFHDALRRAEELDAYVQRTGKLVGPLHGLPISVKDTFKIKGCDATIGLAALANKPATENATLVDLLLSLGAVIIAKTNIPQTLASLDSTNNLFGRTLNPINRRLTAGGSSGGEGVLVAMRGSMAGLGTDIGGSIRVPAMCNGLYGFKPSNGRVPFGGQENGNPEGKGRSGIQAVAGPIARSVSDIDVLMREIVPRAELYDAECIPGCWPSPPQDKTRKFTVGILRSDGRITPLPPIARVIEEVAQTLGRTDGIEVVEIPAPKELGECQSVANALMAADGNDLMMDLIERTGEPLMPWLSTRFKRATPKTLAQLYELQERRSRIEKALMKLWTLPGSDKTRRIDAIIHPVAPHPVPEIDRWNAVGYTSSFVLLDWPAGTIPVRNFTEADLELGKEMDSKILTSWDERNRELWNSKTVDRRVYLGSPLPIQVLTPKLHDYELCRAMDIIDRALHGGGVSSKL